MKQQNESKSYNEIKNYIEKSGLKQKYIAEKAGIKNDAFCNILNGKRKMSLDEYCKICTSLNVPFNYFIKQNND